MEINYRVTVQLVFDIASHESPHKLTEEKIKAAFGTNLISKQIKVAKKASSKETLGVFKPDDVLSFISSERLRKEYNGYSVRMNSERYFVFRDSLLCVACGLEGTKMLLEKYPHDKSAHFNLYGEEDGLDILMTKDHVKPRAVGGSDVHSNFQTMCIICNNLKGSDNLTLEEIKKLREVYSTNKTVLPKKELSKIIELHRTNILRAKNQHHGLVAKVDLYLWSVGGVIIAKSVYDEPPSIDAIHIGCIRTGEPLEIISKEGAKVIAKLCGDQVFCLYEGLLKGTW